MDRTIVLPYEPTTLPNSLRWIPGTTCVLGLRICSGGHLDSCIYISVPRLAITGLGEIDLICTTTTIIMLLPAHVTFKSTHVSLYRPS